MKDFNIAALKRFFRLRNIIKMVSIVLAFVTYYLTFLNWAPTENFITMLQSPSRFNFYSGSSGGFYIQIGGYLDKKSKEEAKQGVNIPFPPFEKTTINSISTAGALDNWNRIITQEAAFGLVNEISTPPHDYAGSTAKNITPLYMERLHVFYRKRAFLNIVLDSSEVRDQPKPPKPTLKSKPDLYTMRFLKNSLINGGPHGSGTRLLTSYFLDAMNISNPNPLLSYNNKVGRDLFKKAKYDIHFAVVGDPLGWIDTLANDPAYGMISIDQELITKINLKFNINLQYANFKGKYEFDDVKQITTAGTIVNLVASQDISAKPIIDLLGMLEEAKPKDFEKKDGYKITDEKFQLEEIDFTKAKEMLKNERISIFQSFLLFIITVLLAEKIIHWILINFISRSKISKYYKISSQIYQNHLASLPQLFNGKYSLIAPNVDQDASAKIRDLCIGFQEIFDVIDKAYSDYKLESITKSDYKELEKEFNSIINVFHKGLYRQIFQAIRNGELIEQSSLDSFLVTGILDSNDYQELSGMAGKKQAQKRKILSAE